MNMSYLLAGSTSVNPIMFALAIGLILGWKVAGYYGLDRYLLPMLGFPGGRRWPPSHRPDPDGAGGGPAPSDLVATIVPSASGCCPAPIVVRGQPATSDPRVSAWDFAFRGGSHLPVHRDAARVDSTAQ